MNAVNPPFLNSVSALFFPETRRVTSIGIGEFIFFENGVDKFPDHRVLARPNQVKVFALDFIHHRVHLRETHNAAYDPAADHKRRDAVGKAAVDHKIAGVR